VFFIVILSCAFPGLCCVQARLTCGTMTAMDLALLEMELESIRNLSGDNLTAKYQELPLYGLPAFRKAWGSLGELHLVLAKDTPFQALSERSLGVPGSKRRGRSPRAHQAWTRLPVSRRGLSSWCCVCAKIQDLSGTMHRFLPFLLRSIRVNGDEKVIQVHGRILHGDGEHFVNITAVLLQVDHKHT